MVPRIFFITGTTTGFGYELVKHVIAQGDVAVATSRNPDALSFEGTTPKNFLAVKLDVTSDESVQAAFDATIKQFGRVDVVVNNAGYGLSGEFESLGEDQIRMQFEINFFGLIRVTKKAMEIMRDLGTGGLIQQVTSIGGQTGVPLFSTYCASKHAVEGFTDALSQEMKPEWKIKFTLVEPGGFRTQWAGESMVFGSSKHPAYDHLNAQAAMAARNGKQVGDPVKGARAMYELAIMEDPPLRVVIGSDAYTRIMNKIDVYTQNYTKYKELSNSCDVVE